MHLATSIGEDFAGADCATDDAVHEFSGLAFAVDFRLPRIVERSADELGAAREHLRRISGRTEGLSIGTN